MRSSSQLRLFFVVAVIVALCVLFITLPIHVLAAFAPQANTPGSNYSVKKVVVV